MVAMCLLHSADSGWSVRSIISMVSISKVFEQRVHEQAGRRFSATEGLQI
jgi:hypothetical protein